MSNNQIRKVTPALGCWALLITFLLTHAIGMVVVYYAWNLGVVGLVAAAGGSVSLISLKTAFGGSLVVQLVRRMTGGPATNVFENLDKE